MVDESDDVQIVALMGALKLASIVSARTPRISRVIARGTSATWRPGFPARTGPVRPDEVAPIEHHICGTTHRVCGQGGAIISTDADTDSHGVTDPSGQAQGHWQCAHRGRSRHVSCPGRGTCACTVGGKERRPLCWGRVLMVELAARESVTGCAAGVPSLAQLLPEG